MGTGPHAKGELPFISSHLLPGDPGGQVIGSFDSLREVQGSDSHGLSRLSVTFSRLGCGNRQPAMYQWLVTVKVPLFSFCLLVFIELGTVLFLFYILVFWQGGM